MKLHLFNPENDIALGYGDKRITLNPVVSRLHVDGAMLPLWYGDDGDKVFSASLDEEWLMKMSRDFNINVSPVNGEVRGADGAPWGWSVDAARTLSSLGANVPSQVELDRIRALSHRRVTVEIMQRLRDRIDMPLPPVPVEAHDVGAVSVALAEWGAVYVKAPWSSSGRGVFRIDSLTEPLEARIKGILRRQGSVMVEKAFKKKRDFAMLFKAERGHVVMQGYSVFFNSIGDAYGGNLLGSQEELVRVLHGDGVEETTLIMLTTALEQILTELIDHDYEGYLGVDMLVDESGNVNPCVELNLRMTMGVVSLLWSRRFLGRNCRGVYRVARDAGKPCCPVVRDGRLVGGRLSLTPAGMGGFSFMVEVDKNVF